MIVAALDQAGSITSGCQRSSRHSGHHVHHQDQLAAHDGQRNSELPGNR
ncbi:MAG TPA: hypothetical protein VFE34_01340 [Dongiaceae bacterium]|jgi:hypothetical protein|nr:hypothetical protein [Dongiaceae bacterium]